ncbi:NUDIX domain-containing protein, partial [bacterium]|nr:NUDIX domain-containing protein [bacterium]
RGDAIFTDGGNLNSKYVIHTATMEMDFKTDYKIIERCMENSLKLTEKLNIKSISFPALGCGTGKLKIEKVSKIMIEKSLEFISQKTNLENINFVLYKKSDFEIFSRVAEEYLVNLAKKTYKNPVPTVDIIIEMNGGIVLIERKNYPYGWALPGGFVEYGESLEMAAVREAKEETGLEIYDLKQFRTYSEPGRDPRLHTISTVFIAKGKGKLEARDDAKNVKIFKRDKLPETFAFDHKKIIEDYYEVKKL